MVNTLLEIVIQHVNKWWRWSFIYARFVFVLFLMAIVLYKEIALTNITQIVIFYNLTLQFFGTKLLPWYLETLTNSYMYLKWDRKVLWLRFPPLEAPNTTQQCHYAQSHNATLLNFISNQNITMTSTLSWHHTYMTLKISDSINNYK